MRFIAIHDLTKCDLNKLVTCVLRRICKSVEQCSASNAVIHMQTGMEIPSISHLHRLFHCLAHSRTRILGDEKVNLDVTIRQGVNVGKQTLIYVQWGKITSDL